MKNEPDSSINIPTSKTAAAAATTLYLASQSARRAITDVRTVLLTPVLTVRYSAARHSLGRTGCSGGIKTNR